MQLGPWRLVDRRGHLALTADEGVATFAGRLVWRGDASIPLELRRRWPHVGDPGASDEVLVDCYQGPPGATAKMFRATDRAGAHADHVHPLVAHPDPPLGPPEAMNNSFVAIAPAGDAMVSGEWDTVHRFLVFPVPSAAGAGELPLTGVLRLDRPVRNVQGAAFLDERTLLCSTDDPGTDLWPVARQLLQVDLDGPLRPSGGAGRVTCLGALPLESRCRGTFEVEGMDYDRASGDLRVIVTPPLPCKLLAVSVYRFRRS